MWRQIVMVIDQLTSRVQQNNDSSQNILNPFWFKQYCISLYTYIYKYLTIYMINEPGSEHYYILLQQYLFPLDHHIVSFAV